jgi:peptidoglycan/xylan/chitin deacetylase (PgdA/CDA1 family)
MSLSRKRWWTKKIARGSLAALSTMLARSHTPRVRVLTYHRFGRVPRDPFCVTPESFEEQVSLLAREGRAVSLEDVVEYARGRRALPGDACLVSMDDGFASMLEVALPILTRHRVPAVAFVTASFVGAGRCSALQEPFLSVDGLRALHAAGVSIGSHALTHRALGRLGPDDARSEIRRSKQRLEDLLGAPITSFAYPFGTHGHFHERTDLEVASAGYEVAFHSQHGAIRAGELARCWHSLPRVKIESGKPPLAVPRRHAWRAGRVVGRRREPLALPAGPRRQLAVGPVFLTG